MEHIIQFGVTVDDDLIQKHIIDKASGEIIAQVQKDINGSYYEPSLINRLVNKETQEFLEVHKDEIIEQASKKLADRLARTKVVKEATQKMVGDIIGE